jgi:hypothetical protein
MYETRYPTHEMRENAKTFVGLFSLAYQLRCIPGLRGPSWHILDDVCRAHHFVSAVCMAAALTSSGSVVQATISPASRVLVQNQSQDPSAISTFKGKILSQNGERFILRDDANDTWYHLDDQQQAGTFLGKNVVVTGVLDQSTDTNRVRSIVEANT